MARECSTCNAWIRTVDPRAIAGICMSGFGGVRVTRPDETCTAYEMKPDAKEPTR